MSVTPRPIHWAFTTIRPFEPGMIVGKGKHVQIACGAKQTATHDPNRVHGIHALDRVSCDACRNSLAYRQTSRRMSAVHFRPNARVAGYEIVVTRTVKAYDEARQLAKQAMKRGWGVQLHETTREKPVVRRSRLWSSSEGRPPP